MARRRGSRARSRDTMLRIRWERRLAAAPGVLKTAVGTPCRRANTQGNVLRLLSPPCEGGGEGGKPGPCTNRLRRRMCFQTPSGPPSQGGESAQLLAPVIGQSARNAEGTRIRFVQHPFNTADFPHLAGRGSPDLALRRPVGLLQLENTSIDVGRLMMLVGAPVRAAVRGPSRSAASRRGPDRGPRTPAAECPE